LPNALPDLQIAISSSSILTGKKTNRSTRRGARTDPLPEERFWCLLISCPWQQRSKMSPRVNLSTVFNAVLAVMYKMCPSQNGDALLMLMIPIARTASRYKEILCGPKNTRSLCSQLRGYYGRNRISGYSRATGNPWKDFRLMSNAHKPNAARS
jgi:hypothetical protein